MTYLKEETEFNNLINNGTILVDFYADWCGPCKAMSPILESMESIDVLKVNVDDFDELASRYGIMSIPTLILFKDGKEISKKIGLIPKEDLETWIQENA